MVEKSFTGHYSKWSFNNAGDVNSALFITYITKSKITNIASLVKYIGFIHRTLNGFRNDCDAISNLNIVHVDL